MIEIIPTHGDKSFWRGFSLGDDDGRLTGGSGGGAGIRKRSGRGARNDILGVEEPPEDLMAKFAEVVATNPSVVSLLDGESVPIWDG